VHKKKRVIAQRGIEKGRTVSWEMLDPWAGRVAVWAAGNLLPLQEHHASQIQRVLPPPEVRFGRRTIPGSEGLSEGLREIRKLRRASREGVLRSLSDAEPYAQDSEEGSKNRRLTRSSDNYGARYPPSAPQRQGHAPTRRRRAISEHCDPAPGGKTVTHPLNEAEAAAGEGVWSLSLDCGLHPRPAS
jgi:hypothetical protein